MWRPDEVFFYYLVHTRPRLYLPIPVSDLGDEQEQRPQTPKTNSDSLIAPNQQPFNPDVVGLRLVDPVNGRFSDLYYGD